ncbi:hypothetical protein MHK_006638, partial [Candidatus Magnetomorum sp. HK-1]
MGLNFAAIAIVIATINLIGTKLVFSKALLRLGIYFLKIGLHKFNDSDF